MDLQEQACFRRHHREIYTIFVACGFSQKEGIDYEETFAPVARYTSIKSVLVLATVMKWKIHQMDVKTAFLNRVVEEEVYVEQPLGFETHDRESHVCRLKKDLIFETGTQDMV